MESTKANLENVPSIIFTTLAKVGWDFLGQHPFWGQGWKPCSLTEAAMYSCVRSSLCKGHCPRDTALHQACLLIFEPFAFPETDGCFKKRRCFLSCTRTPSGWWAQKHWPCLWLSSRPLCTSRHLDLWRNVIWLWMFFLGDSLAAGLLLLHSQVMRFTMMHWIKRKGWHRQSPWNYPQAAQSSREID